jgi:hypothetical protein
MSQATTTDGEAQLPESETGDEYAHLYDTAGVLSMNGAEIEITYHDMMRLRSGLAEGAEHARADARPNTADTFWEIRRTLAPAVGR